MMAPTAHIHPSVSEEGRFWDGICRVALAGVIQPSLRRGNFPQSWCLNASCTIGGGPEDAATPGFGIIQLQAAQAQAAKVESSSQMSIRRPDSLPGPIIPRILAHVRPSFSFQWETLATLTR